MTWLQYLIPQHMLSKLMFRFARIENNFLKNSFTNWFVNHYGVDLSEAERGSVDEYRHFNDFFTRKLKPNARLIESSSIVCPVDGSVSKTGNINNSQILQAKGHQYSVKRLLAGDTRAAYFKQGVFATIYLSPKDYHRIHMPYDGVLQSMTYIPGDLFSVNSKTTNSVDGLFARNERVVCYFETEFGLCAFILVGAIFVGSMETSWHGQINPPYKKEVRIFDYTDTKVKLNKGDELGRFNMGSTVIMLIPNLDINLTINENDNVRVGRSIV